MAVYCALYITACGRLNTEKELSDNLFDFQISIDGTVYQFPMEYSEFEAMGWEYSGDSTEILEAGRWDMPPDLWHKEGYGVYVILANPTTEDVSYSESTVSGILLMDAFLAECDWEIMLPGGIQYDVSNADDIKAAYGEPSYEPDNIDYTMEYIYEGDPDREIVLSVYSDSNTLKFILVQNVIGVDSPEIN